MDTAQDRRLATAARSDQHDDLAALNPERHPAHRLDMPIVLDQIGDRDHRAAVGKRAMVTDQPGPRAAWRTRAVSVITVAVGLSPGLAILSARWIARLPPRVGAGQHGTPSKDAEEAETLPPVTRRSRGPDSNFWSLA